ncbi:hypothetical protein DAPPUDRAFT_256467 [Daphnia pulex]|uniref:Uncharacterized protein n=1 Tax=Daphnia pulex TaxID=6669 RepID=E9HBF5_DAPPU|nr:hypothetical protein DAPPUDRAFT_256467 [Daphnia pulex]|eukprot:EFX70926.1 hypothetical protein DAPPUDRAFT_256467 [Daphnia pulex]
MMTVVEKDEGGSQKEDEWGRSDNNQRREERDHDSRDRKGGRDFGNKNRYQEGREHHNGKENGSRAQRIMRGFLLVPGQGIKLYSIWSATDAGVEFQCAFNTVIFSRNKEIIMEGRLFLKGGSIAVNN